MADKEMCNAVNEVCRKTKTPSEAENSYLYCYTVMPCGHLTN